MNTELPEGWKWVKLKEISESIQYGYTESSSNEAIGPKFLRITDIQDNRVIWDEVPYCKIDEETQKKYLLKEGDLVFARTGATVGKSFLLKGSIPEAVFASYLIRVRVSNEVNDKYLSHFFQSTIYWAQITEGQVGIGQPNVNGSKLGQLSLPLPPKSIQQAIVSKIEELFSEIDKGIEQLKTARLQLKTYRQAVLKWAFEGKLTNETLANGELPEGWKWEKLGSNAFITKLAGFEFTKYVRYKEEGDIPVIRAQNVSKEGFIERNFIYVERDVMQKLPRSRVYGGEILMVFVGAGLGNVGIVPHNKEFFLGPNVAKIALNEQYYNKYIHYFLSSTLGFGNVNGMSKATAQGSISMGNIREVIVPLIPFDKQKEIVFEIESRFSVADKMEESTSQSLQQVEVLRQSILKKAFEGKLH